MRGLGKFLYVEQHPKVVWSLWRSTSG